VRMFDIKKVDGFEPGYTLGLTFGVKSPMVMIKLRK